MKMSDVAHDQDKKFDAMTLSNWRLPNDDQPINEGSFAEKLKTNAEAAISHLNCLVGRLSDSH
jgi:hypothetical protein